MAHVKRGGVGGQAMAGKRIKKEIADLAKEDLGAIILTPNESNIFVWRATIPGPAGSPYEGGEFEVDIRIPDDYPFSPPHLQFATKVYHCNVASTGAICLDLLKTAWSPALSLYKVILSLSSLLTDPNPADPLVPAIATEYKRTRKVHDDKAREWTKLYAMPKPQAKIQPAPAPIRNNSSTSTGSSHARRNIPRTSQPSTAVPPPQIAGTRRPNAVIDLADSDDSDVEAIIQHAPNGQARAKASNRRVKRARPNGTTTNGESSGAGTADDVIVVDE